MGSVLGVTIRVAPNIQGTQKGTRILRSDHLFDSGLMRGYCWQSFGVVQPCRFAWVCTASIPLEDRVLGCMQQGFRVGMFPLYQPSLIGIIVSPTIIPIQDC